MGLTQVNKTWIHHGESDLSPPLLVIDNTRQPQMSDMTAFFNDLSYIPLNNKQNEPTQGDISETSNDPTQAKHNEFEELYASANKELAMLTKMCISLVCNTSRWKDSNTPGKKVPKKVLCYFSIISRLQRFYKSSHTAKEMTWHAIGKYTKPDNMQHPVDGRAWKDFNTKYSYFSAEPRNVRLGLVLMVSIRSETLVSLTACKDIDVYFRLLIDDLKDLWAKTCVETIDVATSQKFNMRAMVLWTINDFPARSNLSGWSGLGYKACLTCNEDTLYPQAAYSFTPEDRKCFVSSSNELNYQMGLDPTLSIKSQVFKLLGKSIGLRSVICSDHQELKKEIWYVLHNSPEIDTYQAKLKIEFPNKDMKEEFPGWFGKQIRQRQVDNDPGVNESSELFALACGPSQTPISVNSCVVNDVSLNDLKITALHIDGQSIDVDALPDIIDVIDEDDDIIDAEMSADVARGYGGNGGGVDHPPPYHVPTGCGGCLGNRDPHASWYHAGHLANYLGELVRELPLHYPSWRQMPSEQNARVVAKIRMETSATRDYPSLIHTFLLTHSVGGVFLNPVDKSLYDEIMAIVHGGKQRGHISGVGRVFPGQGTVIPLPSQSTHSVDIARLKKSKKRLMKKVNMFIRLFRSDEKFSQMLRQLKSQHEYGGGSGSGGCGDDEPEDDKDGDEDEEDKDDS
nr:hypothetical protein [Tanacetum cinerariifolium]